MSDSGNPQDALSMKPNPSYQTSVLVKCEGNVAYGSGLSHKEALQAEEAQYEVIDSAHHTQLQPVTLAGAEVSPEPHDAATGSRVGVATSGWSYLVVVLVLVVLCLLSVTAIVVSVVTAATVEGSSKEDADGRSLMVELRAEIQALELRLEALEPAPQTASVATPQGSNMSMTTPPATTLAMTTPPSPFMDGVVTLREVNLFQNCTTRVEQTCNIPPGIATGVCSTTPVPLNTPGEYVLNMNCLRAAETPEPNPLIGTLDVFDDTAVCLCYVPDLDNAGTRRFDVMCGIQVTRCASPLDIMAVTSN